MIDGIRPTDQWRRRLVRATVGRSTSWWGAWRRSSGRPSAPCEVLLRGRSGLEVGRRSAGDQARPPPCSAASRPARTDENRFVGCMLDKRQLTIHPPSPMHSATRWRHECLSWADASTFLHVNPILWSSFFTTSLQFIQFILGLPGLLLNPATSQRSACYGMRKTKKNRRNYFVQLNCHLKCLCTREFESLEYVTCNK